MNHNFLICFVPLNQKTIHQRCKNVLITETYKYLNDLSPEFINEHFYLRQNHYNLRSLPLSFQFGFAKLNSAVYRANQL